MNLFEPRTFSTDWEIVVMDKLERVVKADKLVGFADMLRAELDLPIQIDYHSLEFAMGINTSFAQMWERVQRATDRAGQLLREYGLELCPGGAHPKEPSFNSAHVHVGTVLDETQAIYLENQLTCYVPAFAALAANSPFSHGQRGEYKSYRVRQTAYGCTRPAPLRDPWHTQQMWGTDASAKLYSRPTLEIRIPDCATSRRFLAELATFVAAYVHYQGTRLREEMPSKADYRDYLVNRWSAAKHGLQATFHHDTGIITAVEMLDGMLDACHEELAQLGVRRAELVVIEAMLKKRVCQADMALELSARYPDPYCLASVYAKLGRHWEMFAEYLERTPALAPLPAPDAEAIMQEHLAQIGEGTHYYESRESMFFPPPMADAMIENMIEGGYIRREVSERAGVMLHRNGC